MKTTGRNTGATSRIIAGLRTEDSRRSPEVPNLRPSVAVYRWIAPVLLILLVLPATAVRAQELLTEPGRPLSAGGLVSRDAQSAGTAEASGHSRAAAFGTFLAGGAMALGVHESGHVVFAELFGAGVSAKAVHFGPLPFFAITYRGTFSRRERFAVSSAGFWMQHATSETILTLRPHLRRERAPVVKGMLAFDVISSFFYAGAAFAKVGPGERDTRGMAEALGTSERWVGLLVLAPAVLDTWRYFHPDSRWARWASRGVKVGGVLLVIK